MTQPANARAPRQPHLGAFLMESGQRIAAWRHPDAHDEAQEKSADLQSLIHPAAGLSPLSNMAGGVDLSRPMPELPETNGGRSRQRLLSDLARRDNLTIRELYRRIAEARGHLQVVGTLHEMADPLQQWFEEEGADSFAPNTRAARCASTSACRARRTGMRTGARLPPPSRDRCRANSSAPVVSRFVQSFTRPAARASRASA
jgi:hypothetical protein